jgi:membrane fusion protein, multidrug efflux system
LNLGYTTIASPVTGIISFAHVDVGNVVGPAKDSLLATVSTIDPTKVLFQLSESDYLKVAKELPNMRAGAGPQLALYLSNGSLYPYPGRATNIDRAVDPTTGTISVESIFPNPRAFLRPGQFARVQFTISQQRNALVIPQSAITAYQGTPIVYVVGPGNAVLIRSVETGSTIGGNVVVSSGLKAGDAVVVSPSSSIHAGSVVTIEPEQK